MGKKIGHNAVLIILMFVAQEEKKNQKEKIVKKISKEKTNHLKNNF